MNANQKAELEQMEWQRTNPQQSSATIQELHAEVWAFRREMHPYFPTPSQADSLAFAFTEIAEAVDATLRQNPVYKRNNTKEHSVERELAQCAMMLLTAIPSDWWGWHETQIFNTDNRVGRIAMRIAKLYDYEHDGPRHDYELQEIRQIVGLIASVIDLFTHLRAELARMRAKHGPVIDDGPASLNEPANEHIIYMAPTEGLQGEPE